MSTTTAQARRRLGTRLGPYWIETTTSLAAATNQLVIAGLVDAGAESTLFKDCFAMPVAGSNAGEVRRILDAGFAPASGTITVSRAHTNATASAVTVEIGGVLPPARFMGRDGLLDCINYALAEAWFVDTLSIAGVAGQYQYSLSAYPWLAEDAVVDVYIRRSGGVRDVLLPEWRFLNDLDTPQLEIRTPISVADTLKVHCYRPLDTWIKTGTPAVWAASTVGLVAETDECLLDLDGVEAIGLYYAYRTLEQVGPESDRASSRNRAEQQRVRANTYKKNLPHERGRDHAHHWFDLGSRVNFPREGSLGA